MTFDSDMLAPIDVILLTCISVSHCLNPNDFCGLDCDDGIPNTICLTKCKVGKTCKALNAPAFSESDKQYLLDIHNYLRNHLALGKMPYIGEASSNMMALNYDNELAEMALCWAKQCITNIDPCSKSKRYGLIGQNFFKVTFGSKITSYMDLTHIYAFVTSWFATYPMAEENVLQHYVPGHHRQFTQIIWAKTTHVGCARIVHDEIVEGVMYNSLDMVCNYGPAGNIVNESAYEVGSPASNCPANTRRNIEYFGLCGKVHILSLTRKTVMYRAGVDDILADQYLLLFCWCLSRFIKFV